MPSGDPSSVQPVTDRVERQAADAVPGAVIITCSALLREIQALIKANGWTHLEVASISAELHNRPERIPDAVEKLVDTARAQGQLVFVAYGDCGTGGRLDALLEREGVERIPGAHCYQFYSGSEQFRQFEEAELGTFYLTDFLVRHFDRLVIRGLGLDRKPELEPLLFGHYRKLLYLAQSEDEELQQRAQAAAQRLGLSYAYHYTGSGELGRSLQRFNRQLRVGLS
ncbi:DUF1638 domain-containing protein [Sedimenticola sp.]|uniref:DUF1638 domain-containing protein n=1 Tax=Sedimenticola sp. TaxID=1940285 RepID=UPI003D130BA3